MLERWKKFVYKMNVNGIPIPMIKDPRNGASVSLTLVFISFNVWLISIIGKWAGALGGVDSGQTLNMFIVCAGLYWGRKFQRDEKGNVSLGDKDPNAEK